MKETSIEKFVNNFYDVLLLKNRHNIKDTAMDIMLKNEIKINFNSTSFVEELERFFDNEPRPLYELYINNLNNFELYILKKFKILDYIKLNRDICKKYLKRLNKDEIESFIVSLAHVFESIAHHLIHKNLPSNMFKTFNITTLSYYKNYCFESNINLLLNTETEKEFTDKLLFQYKGKIVDSRTTDIAAIFIITDNILQNKKY